MDRFTRAIVLVTVGHALIACNTGRMRPLHRPEPASGSTQTTSAPEAPATSPTSPTTTTATAPTSVEPTPVDEPSTTATPATKPTPATTPTNLPSISDHPWCRMAKSGAGFIVTRYAFERDLDQSVYMDQIVVAADQPAKATGRGQHAAWAEAGSPAAAKVRMTVEALSTNDARAFKHSSGRADYAAQTALVDAMLDNNPNVPPGVELGQAGGLRLKYADLRAPNDEFILFTCAEYTPAFDRTGSLKTQVTPTAPARDAANSPATPTSPTAKPAAPTVDASAPPTHVAPFRAKEIKAADLMGTKWCAWIPAPDGMTVSVLQFGSKASGVTMQTSRFSRAKLEADKLDMKALMALLQGKVIESKIDRVDDARVIAEDQRSFRYAEDVNGRKALILDQAGPNDPPAPGAETYFECVSTLIPAAQPLLGRNLKFYVDTRERWANESK